MIVFIAANHSVAKAVVEKMYVAHNEEFCAIEAEYGENKITKQDTGIVDAYNHHMVGRDSFQPCLAFQDNVEYKNFIISHVDADTIFGIGWLSGIFKTNPYITKILTEISNMISVMDNFGYHSIPEKDLALYKKEFEVCMSYVAHAKNSIQKVKFKNYYNCSSIILKTLFNIAKIISNKDLLENRYKLIMKSKSNPNSNDPLKSKLPESTKIVHIYKKRINDFKDNDHQFIIVWDITLSIYGRTLSIVQKYFPEGLAEFLKTLDPEAGGGLITAGTERRRKIYKDEYQKIIEAFLERLR